MSTKSDDRGLLLLLVSVVVAALSIKVLWAKFVYGDGLCAFAECRKVVK